MENFSFECSFRKISEYFIVCNLKIIADSKERETHCRDNVLLSISLKSTFHNSQLCEILACKVLPGWDYIDNIR